MLLSLRSYYTNIYFIQVRVIIYLKQITEASITVFMHNHLTPQQCGIPHYNFAKGIYQIQVFN